MSATLERGARLLRPNSLPTEFAPFVQAIYDITEAGKFAEITMKNGTKINVAGMDRSLTVHHDDPDNADKVTNITMNPGGLIVITGTEIGYQSHPTDFSISAHRLYMDQILEVNEGTVFAIDRSILPEFWPAPKEPVEIVMPEIVPLTKEEREARIAAFNAIYNPGKETAPKAIATTTTAAAAKPANSGVFASSASASHNTAKRPGVIPPAQSGDSPFENIAP